MDQNHALRVEILSVAIAMLALLAGKAPIQQLQWNSRPALAASLALALIALSLLLLYQASFPRLAGGRRSLLYFREIAQRKETTFIAEFCEQSEEAYLKDLLAQVWRNSEILNQKYDYIKYSFLLHSRLMMKTVLSSIRSSSPICLKWSSSFVACSSSALQMSLADFE